MLTLTWHHIPLDAKGKYYLSNAVTCLSQLTVLIFTFSTFALHSTGLCSWLNKHI